jgi:hypothetical protein
MTQIILGGREVGHNDTVGGKRIEEEGNTIEGIGV